ncbi:MAG: DUF6933 domain-containing protein, partial [Burkholderiales bacterium]
SSYVALRRVMRRLGGSEKVVAPAPPTNALGDWYVNLLHIDRIQMVMATSERSLLTVLLPARDLRRSLIPNLCDMMGMLLLEIGVAPELAAREIEAMQPAVVRRTESRSVLASMNDFALALRWHVREGLPPMEIMLRFADTPKSALREDGHNFGRPATVTRTLLVGNA